MKMKVIDYFTNLIIKHKECNEVEIKTIRYGLETIYILVTKMIVILITVIFLKSVKEFLLLLISYSLIRKYSFGLHASKSWICWCTTLPIYIGGSLIIKYAPHNIYVSYLIWTVALISFALWAPADTPKRPLIREKQRKQQKIKTCITCIILIILMIVLKNDTVTKAFTLGLFIQSIVINPLTYKITNTPFNNYKFYPNKV